MHKKKEDICVRVDVVIDQCRLVVRKTADFGSITAATNFGPTCGGETIVPCTSTSAGNLALSCMIENPMCSFVAASPLPNDPHTSNVEFQLMWDEVIEGTINGHTCSVTHSVVDYVMLQLATAPEYNCELVEEECEDEDEDDELPNYACYCASVYNPTDSTCHLVCTAAFCIEFEALKMMKRRIHTKECFVGPCDPKNPPQVCCPTHSKPEEPCC